MESEITRLRHELEEQAQAAWMGLYGLAAVAKHQTITRRMECMTETFLALAAVVGEEQAIQTWIQVTDHQKKISNAGGYSETSKENHRP